jgi:hypothetical protein
MEDAEIAELLEKLRHVTERLGHLANFEERVNETLHYFSRRLNLLDGALREIGGHPKDAGPRPPVN